MSSEPATPFVVLSDVVTRVAGVSGRLAKRRILAEFIQQLRTEEIPAGMLLVIGRIFGDADQRVLNVGWAAVQRSLEAPQGDAKVGARLTLLDVHHAFEEIAQAKGPDSQRQRQALLQELFARASDVERETVLKIISGEMRMGASEGLLLDAIAEAAGVPAKVVREAHRFEGDIGRLAQRAMTEGARGLAGTALQLLEPVRPMLADLGADAADVLEKHGGQTAVEFKLDGVRIQIHRAEDQVRVFSRRLTEVTASVPEAVELARALPGSSLIVEGELIAVDATGRPRAFQEVMRRFLRVHDIEQVRREVPVKLQLFDLLWLDGRSYIDEPYSQRWAALEALVPAPALVPRRVCSTAQDIDAFLAEAMSAGHEGLMAKELTAPYTVGRRGKHWLKLKPAETLDVAILAAEWGHGRRTGTLSNYWLGVRDGDKWQMIGKTFKGLTDVERLEVMQRLIAAKSAEDDWKVEARPEVIVEVTYNEIQKSPRYASGFALRFARVTRIRGDKGPHDADTYERLQALYQRQFERKAK